ncbi:MAG: VWA domain-containing protein [Methylohalobius sp.]|nr:VWA domain-containing protein [Methylohalobius sp.]
MPEIGFAHPLWLFLLPLATLPYLPFARRQLPYPALAVLTGIASTTWPEKLHKACSCAFLSCLIVSASCPFVKEQKVARLGQGAHIVLTIDHSSSMNENFSGRYFGGSAHETKSAAARRLLIEFIRRRPKDLFGVVAFSTAPRQVLPLTADKEAIIAAVGALGMRGRGLTNIAPGLAMALETFRGQPLTGSRVILLVSDGGARIDPDVQDRLRQDFQDLAVNLYWVYLRNPSGVSVLNPPKRRLSETSAPEIFLHQYFQTLGVPYRVFEAENPQSLAQAIATVETLENRPLPYFETLPRRDLSPYGFGLALILGVPLLSWAALEIERWLA